MPHNLEAERSVLGAILLHNDALDIATTVVMEADFYRDAHRRIFKAMLVGAERKANLDLVTIKDILGKTGELDEVGGPGYIAALVDGVPRSMNVEHYANIIREKAILRNIIFAANKMMSSAYADDEDASKVLAEADRAIVDLQNGRGGIGLVDVKSSVPRILSDLEYRVEHRGQITGIDTGFSGINDTTLGWQRGDLVVVAARPSIGKTSFVLNTAKVAAMKGRVAMFSMEMRKKQLEDRLLSSISGVPLTRIITGFLTSDDWKRLSEAIEVFTHGMQFFINDRSGRTAWDIRSECRRMRAEGGLDLVVIDYVQLMPGSLDNQRATRNEQVTDISRRLKELAADCDVPILLLSQLSRANEKRNDPRPKLSDLRESGALEQDADIVCFLHRKNHREGGLTNFIIEKQRQGPTGTIDLNLDRDTVTFTDADPDAPALEPVQAPTGPTEPEERSFLPDAD